MFHQISNRPTLLTKVSHESPKETKQPVQTFHFCLVRRPFQILQTLKFVDSSIQATILNHMSQYFHTIQQKFTLDSTNFQIVLINQLQNTSSILQTFSFISTKHHHIIHIHEAYGIQQLIQQIVHHGLKHARRVFMPKWHFHELKSPLSSHKRQILLRVIFHWNLPKPFREVELSKHFSSATQTMYYILYVW